MRRPKSDIPADAIEKVISAYSEERHGTGGVFQPETVGYYLNDSIVGYRYYNAARVKIKESPRRDGLKHGREFSWDDEGTLVSVEPYFKGKAHGTAKQYDRHGRVIGTYKMVHGTGYDVWRQRNFDGPVSSTTGMCASRGDC